MTRHVIAVALVAAAVVALPARADEKDKAPPAIKHEVTESHRQKDDPTIPSVVTLVTDLEEEEAVAWIASRSPGFDATTIKESVAKVYARTENATTVVNVSKARVFLYLRTRDNAKFVTVLEKSDTGWPVLPAGVLEGTITPKGFTDADNKQWREAVCRRLARSGECNVLVQFDNGNAFKVAFKLKTGDDLNVRFDDQFVKQGAYAEKDFDVIVRGADGFSSTAYDGEKRRGILDGADIDSVR